MLSPNSCQMLCYLLEIVKLTDGLHKFGMVVILTGGITQSKEIHAEIFLQPFYTFSYGNLNVGCCVPTSRNTSTPVAMWTEFSRMSMCLSVVVSVVWVMSRLNNRIDTGSDPRNRHCYWLLENRRWMQRPHPTSYGHQKRWSFLLWYLSYTPYSIHNAIWVGLKRLPWLSLPLARSACLPTMFWNSCLKWHCHDASCI